MNWFKNDKTSVSLNRERSLLEISLNEAEEEYDNEKDKLRNLEADTKRVKENMAYWDKQIKQLRKQLANS